MKIKIFPSILALFTFVGGSATADTKYDFNDTFSANFTAINGSGVIFTNNAGAGVMTNTGAADIQSTAYRWDGVSRTAAQSWVLSVDATATAALHDLAVDNGAWASLGIVVANSSAPLTSHLFFQHYVGDDAPSRGFETTLGGVDRITGVPSTITPNLRLNYDSNTRILSALSEGGTVLRSVNVQTTWGMSDTDTFLFGVAGYVELGTIPTDRNYASLDNLCLEDVPGLSGPEIVVEAPGGDDLVDGDAEVDFGTALVGSNSDAQIFTVRNSGDTDLTGVSVSVSGAAAADYIVDDSLLGATIAADGTATFSVTFSPTTQATHAATLLIASDDEDENPFQIDLIGSDVLPTGIPFSDGISNLLKYAFNMNLAGADSHTMVPDGTSGLPGGTIVEVDGDTFWRVQFVRRLGSGLIYVPKKSTTLAPGSFEAMTGVSSEEVIDANWVRVTIDESYNPQGTPRFFSVVEVSLP